MPLLKFFHLFLFLITRAIACTEQLLKRPSPISPINPLERKVARLGVSKIVVTVGRFIGPYALDLVKEVAS